MACRPAVICRRRYPGPSLLGEYRVGPASLKSTFVDGRYVIAFGALVEDMPPHVHAELMAAGGSLVRKIGLFIGEAEVEAH